MRDQENSKFATPFFSSGELFKWKTSQLSKERYASKTCTHRMEKLSFEMLENESKRHWQRIAAIAHGLIIIIIDKYYH